MLHLDMKHFNIPCASITPEFTKLSTAQPQLAVETAMDTSGAAGLARTKIPNLYPAAASVTRKPVIPTATSVPTTFDPTALNVHEVLLAENLNAIMREDPVLKMRWLPGDRDGSSAKCEVSLILTVADADTTDRLIAHTFSIFGHSVPCASLSIPPAVLSLPETRPFGTGAFRRCQLPPADMRPLCGP